MLRKVMLLYRCNGVQYYRCEETGSEVSITNYRRKGFNKKKIGQNYFITKWMSYKGNLLNNIREAIILVEKDIMDTLKFSVSITRFT